MRAFLYKCESVCVHVCDCLRAYTFNTVKQNLAVKFGAVPYRNRVRANIFPLYDVFKQYQFQYHSNFILKFNNNKKKNNI